jgi:hypothetical protein
MIRPMPEASAASVSLVQIGGLQPPISKMLSFELDLIWTRCAGPQPPISKIPSFEVDLI